jgi:outer membrane PBP1 activator LpoA protein
VARPCAKVSWRRTTRPSKPGRTRLSFEFYDSSRVSSIDEFYKKAQADGVQLVVGPLEKPLVKQLSARSQLPITTLALNYSEATKARRNCSSSAWRLKTKPVKCRAVPGPTA